MTDRPTAAVILVAAGRGARAGGGVPKQWRDLRGLRVADRTVAAFRAHPAVREIVAVLHPDEMDALPALTCVPGGATRTASVRAGLAAVAEAQLILIHDMARPLVRRETIDAVLGALAGAPAAAPGLPVTDALWAGSDGRVTGLRERAGLWRAQTPQGFRTAAIRAAHAQEEGRDHADDVAVALAAGLDVALVPGDEENLKITHPEDFARAAAILAAREGAAMDVRLGNGYDVHRFGPGDHVMLCGLRVPHGRGLQGHSDADVGLHALADALYGALAEGDIGRHFPPSDPRWKGAASDAFLAHASGRAAARGYAIANLDLTLVCEAPKIGPHADAMRARVADICGIDAGRVSVKATTSERLGFTGREEGIAAIATAALVAA